jgi:hypothetical protein
MIATVNKTSRPMSLSPENKMFSLSIENYLSPSPKCLFAVIAAPRERNPVSLGVRSERTIHGVGHWLGGRGKEGKAVTEGRGEVRRRGEGGGGGDVRIRARTKIDPEWETNGEGEGEGDRDAHTRTNMFSPFHSFIH